MALSEDPQADAFLDRLFADYEQAKADGARVRASRESTPQTTQDDFLAAMRERGLPSAVEDTRLSEFANEDPIIAVARMLRKQADGWE